MKSVAGAILVLAGALIIGLASGRMPYDGYATVSSMGLIVIGLVVVFTGMKSASPGKKE